MADMAALVSRLEAVADRLEKVGGAGGSGGDSAAAVTEFDNLINGALKAYIDASNGLGGLVAEQAAMVADAFNAQRAFLEVASKSKKPAASAMPGLMGDMSAALTKVGEIKDANRRSEFFNHLSGVADGVPALGWVQVEPTPCPFIKDMLGAAQFYTNRVIKDKKESAPEHVAWARSWCTVITDLEVYVKQFHTTGLVWNPKGGEASVPAKAAPAAAAPAKPKPAAATGGDGGDAKAGLFAALNKGGLGVTAGLKKVDRSQMTHKNPELRGSSKVPGEVKKSVAPAKKFGASTVKKDPVLQLNGKKWVCEYQENNKEIIIETEGVNQTLYVYKCNNSTIQVKGKINAITLDGCKKTAIVFDTCVAAFELVNCQSIQVQVIERVKTVTIDKTDGALVYLSKDCMDAEVVSAKSSEMNIALPTGPDGEFKEYAIPEQFKTTFDEASKKLVTGPTDIAA